MEFPTFDWSAKRLWVPIAEERRRREEAEARGQDFEGSVFGDFDFGILFPRYGSIFDFILHFIKFLKEIQIASHP